VANSSASLSRAGNIVDTCVKWNCLEKEKEEMVVGYVIISIDLNQKSYVRNNVNHFIPISMAIIKNGK